MPKIEFNTLTENWTDLPLHQILYEWIVKNVGLPTEMGTIVAYLALFLIAWYSIVWMTRFVISMIWPLFLIGLAIIIFRILQFYEQENIADIFTKTLTVVLDTVKMPVAVRLVEVMTLITFLGILSGVSIFVVIAQRASFVVLLLITPLTYILYGILHVAEKILVGALEGLLCVTYSVSNSMN